MAIVQEMTCRQLRDTHAKQRPWRMHYVNGSLAAGGRHIPQIQAFWKESPREQSAAAGRTGDEEDGGALDGVVPELGDRAEAARGAPDQHAEQERERAVHDVPGGVAPAAHRQVDEQRVARDGDRVVEARGRHDRRGDGCKNEQDMS